MEIIPREYQKDPVRKAIKYLKDPKKKRPGLVVAPTGSGKSYLIAFIAKYWKEPILVLQPTKELLEQNISKIRELGIEATEYSASVGIKELSKITYATLGSIKGKVEELKALGIKTVLIDECHTSFSPSPDSAFSIFMNELKPKKVIGLTATPFRLVNLSGGSQLNLLTRMSPKFFSFFIDIIQIQDIIKLGFWSKFNYEIHNVGTDLLIPNSSGSEFTEDSILNTSKSYDINNKIYKRVIKLQKDGVKNALVFVDSLATAEKLAEYVPNSAVVHGKMPKKLRTETIRKFKEGEIQVVFNYGVLTTGFDFPDLRCVILGRPTMSLALYYQKVGRGSRISKETGKEDCLIIDFGSNYSRFGDIQDLVIEHVENYGMCITNNGSILTNTLLGALLPKKKEVESGHFNTDADINIVMTFGKFKYKKIRQLPFWYIDFLLSDNCDIKFMTPKMRKVKSGLVEVYKMKTEGRFY